MAAIEDNIQVAAAAGADASNAAAEPSEASAAAAETTEIWRGVLGDDNYKLIQELIDLTDPQTTESPPIVKIYNGVVEGKKGEEETVNPPDDETRQLCIDEHRAMRATFTKAIRFFHARQGDVPAASRQLARHLLWRARRNKELREREAASSAAAEGAAADDKVQTPAIFSHIPKELMEEGSFKAAGRDKQGRPILCVRARLWAPGRFAEADEEEYAMYMLDHIELKMNGSKSPNEWAERTPVGEQWVVLFDMTKWTTANSDIATVKRLIRILVMNYPDRLGMAIIFNAPFLFSAVWAIISPFLEEVTRKKVLFVKNNRDGSVADALANVIDVAALEEDFGGTHDQYPAPAFV